ncbi:MAG: sulfatase-like hydrolase/transferase [Verrucomicrobiaceae bacterium]
MSRLFPSLAVLIIAPASALDQNNNGISDVWESLHPSAAAAPFDDFDADGCLNHDEGRAFTDPNDANSSFKANVDRQTNSTDITFPGEPWMRDLTQTSPDLLNWTRQSAPVLSDGSDTTVTIPFDAGKNFVRRIRHEALNSDTDSLTNKEEALLGTDPLKWDTDGDKVADDIEFLQGTDPLTSVDSDGDTIPDHFEQWCLNHSDTDAFTNLTHISRTTDFDGDTVTDGQEFSLGTSPVIPVKNILFFITEDQSLHLGLYDSNPVGGFTGDSPNPEDNTTRGLDTPHIDALGTGGVVFDRAFCLSPVCSPSKMALYTGTFPHTNSAHRNVFNYGVDFPLPSGSDPSNTTLGGVHEDLPTLIEVLRDRGWYTAVSSKSHVQPVRKFPYHEGHPNLGTPAAATTAMNDVITRAGNRPFFFWANVGSPHLPFKAVPNANGVWDPSGGLTGDGGVTNIDANAIDVPNCYPDVPGVRQDIADYLGSIKVIDGIVQACVDTLANRGIDGETLIIFTSDHGIGLHRAKQSIYSTGLQIPLLVAGPGVSGNRRITEPVSHLDIAPTLTDYIGMPRLPGHLGKSLRPIFEGTQNDIPDRDTMLTACHRYYDARAVTDGRYYYVRNISKPSGTLANPALALNTDQYQGGSPWFNRTYDATLAATGTLGRELLLQSVTGKNSSGDPLPDEELFDLDADLWCTNNLINDPSLAPIIANLRHELSEWRTLTEDYNSDPSELSRRTQQYHSPVSPPTGTPTDSFDGKSRALNADPDWTLAIAGNGGADFTFASDQASAPAGPLTLGSYDLISLDSETSFTASVKTGFNGNGVASGLAFGIVPDGGSSSFWQFMLADGRSTPGGTGKDVRLVRVTQGSASSTLIAENSLADYSANGDLYTLQISGTQGSSLVDLRIFTPAGVLYYENLAFDLGTNIPLNSRFGLTTWSSGSSIFDDFRVETSAPAQ